MVVILIAVFVARPVIVFGGSCRRISFALAKESRKKPAPARRNFGEAFEK